jgi:hypothetical protein
MVAIVFKLPRIGVAGEPPASPSIVEAPPSTFEPPPSPAGAPLELLLDPPLEPLLGPPLDPPLEPLLDPPLDPLLPAASSDDASDVVVVGDELLLQATALATATAAIPATPCQSIRFIVLIP